MEPRLEEVFKTSGVPTYTFVPPNEYTSLLVSLRTPGRGVVVEGPSGIGKTTAVLRALDEVKASSGALVLSARKRDDIEFIRQLPEIPSPGTVIVDDFHRLGEDVQRKLADYLKVIADEASGTAKLILIGINKAGQSLLAFGDDVAGRIDIIKFESNTDTKVDELVRKGESALNVDMAIRSSIVDAAQGSFFIAQMLSLEACKKAMVLERVPGDAIQTLAISFETVRLEVFSRLEARFRKRTEEFCRGTRFRKEGRAPYLSILNWLASGKEWSLCVPDVLRLHPGMSGSVSQIVDRGYLKQLISGSEPLSDVLHFDRHSQTITVEDPQYVFYVRNIPWTQFAKDLGFVTAKFDRRYDFALSFAGDDRAIAKALFDALQEREVEVFYDANEQHRILAEDLEEYLKPIYRSEALFVVCLLGKSYPTRIWTKVESDQFKARFADGHVVPMMFDDTPLSTFDIAAKTGGFVLKRGEALAPQIENFADLLVKKLGEANRAS